MRCSAVAALSVVILQVGVKPFSHASKPSSTGTILNLARESVSPFLLFFSCSRVLFKSNLSKLEHLPAAPRHLLSP